MITSPELEKILNKVHEKWNYELHKVDFAIKYSDFRKEFSWEQEVIHYVEGITIENRLVYLFFGIDDCPIFLVDGKWALMNFRLLWEHINNDAIWIISQDFNHGVLVSQYLGYLEHDPNPKDIIYAITKWVIYYSNNRVCSNSNNLYPITAKNKDCNIFKKVLRERGVE